MQPMTFREMRKNLFTNDYQFGQKVNEEDWKFFSQLIADWMTDNGYPQEYAEHVRNGYEMPAILDTYNWEEVFGFGGDEHGNSQGETPHVSLAYPHAKCNTELFSRRDVKEIIHIVEGENDESSWICIGQLWDGRYFKCIAGCDYTGWDCQASGICEVADDYDELMRLAITPEEMDRINQA